jgi:(p)ppGpp synthase/HD superfamily hydrolase
LDEPGLLAVISQTISSHGINIAGVNFRTTKDKKAIGLFDIEVNDLTQLQKLTSTLESKKGIISVERMKS